MPDFSMCVASECPFEVRTSCIRFMAVESNPQGWADFSANCGTPTSYFREIAEARVLPVFEAEARRRLWLESSLRAKLEAEEVV
jgi:hypothetical protein